MRLREANGMKTICACDSRLICLFIYAFCSFVVDSTHKYSYHRTLRTQRKPTFHKSLTETPIHHVFLYRCVRNSETTQPNRIQRSIERVRKQQQQHKDRERERKSTLNATAALPLEVNAYKTTLYEWSAIHFSIAVQ